MSSAALRLPSFEDLYAQIIALPEGMTGEILGPGELRTMSRPASLHRGAALRLAAGLGRDNMQVGGTGWWIEVEAEIQLFDRLYVPDLSGWRLADPPDFLDENPITVVPDWVCEILSRGTQKADRIRKLPTYAAAGVGHMWIVDPAARTLEVYASHQGLALLVATGSDEDQVELPPFDHPTDVGALWKPPGRAPREG